jgi:HPt (histidine-containing phosphotransfer) domain-containing protein
MAFTLDEFTKAYGDNPEILREIFRLYLRQAPERIATIREGLRHQDFSLISAAAHSLANTSGTLKSRSAVAAARALETAARSEEPEACRREADRLESTVEEIVRAVAAELAEGEQPD